MLTVYLISLITHYSAAATSAAAASSCSRYNTLDYITCSLCFFNVYCIFNINTKYYTILQLIMD